VLRVTAGVAAKRDQRKIGEADVVSEFDSYFFPLKISQGWVSNNQVRAVAPNVDQAFSTRACLKHIKMLFL
jgi:hypothetical protein